MKRSDVLMFSIEKVVKKYRKLFLKMCGNPAMTSVFLCLMHQEAWV